jgi:hypothetical protein
VRVYAIYWSPWRELISLRTLSSRGRCLLGLSQVRLGNDVSGAGAAVSQVRFMHLWFKQAGVPGRITRLLSAGGGDHLGKSAPCSPRRYRTTRSRGPSRVRG